ncbi:MAG: hypothetical protein Q9181_008068 [Wetmoreana brouardii]
MVGHSQKPPTMDVPNLGLVPTPDLPPMRSFRPISQPSDKQGSVDVLRSNQTLREPSAGDSTQSAASDLDEWIQQLRDSYGSQKPQFLREKGAVEVGETKVIVEAKWRGNYPLSEPTRLLITAQRWDENFIFWLREYAGQRYIVAPFEVEGSTIYRRWYRSEKAFMQRTFAFEPDATMSNGLATTEQREKQLQSSQAQTTQGKNRQQLRETAYTSTAMSPPARPGKRHRDIATNENPEDARPSKSRSRVLDTTQRVSDEASVEKQQDDMTTINPADALSSDLQAVQAQQRKQQLRQQLHTLFYDDRKLYTDELQEIEKEEEEKLKGRLSPSDPRRFV